jgi:hypothetical protein
MSPERVFEQVLQNIADGHPVDWDLLESGTGDPEDRECLKWLRVLGNIADLHRSDHQSLDASSHESIAENAIPRGPAHHAPVLMWGRFRLLQKVGEGSFGSVHRAWDPQLEREIAIKILHGHVASATVTERLLREGRGLAKVRHPNVVSVLGVESHAGQVGLCMDFVRGQTLEDVLRAQGTLSAGEALLIGQDVCRALAAVHRAGLVHRDVKTRNVMREQAGRIVLMDFGTGREAESLETASGHDLTGTPLYMAPEVLAGAPASARSDVYSVGVLLYRLVTAEYPVDAATVDTLNAAHREGRRRFISEARPDLPAAFVRAIERALAADPNERYASAAAFLDALSGVFPHDEQTTWQAARRFVGAGLAVMVSAGAMVAPGFLTSAAFNVTLERSDFATETMWDWWLWGLRAHVGPVVLLAMVCIATAVFFACARLVVGLSSTAGYLTQWTARRLRTCAGRLSLHDASALGSWVLLLSFAGLVSAWWYFSPLIVTLCTPVSNAAPESHALLSPAYEAYQTHYWQTFTFLIVLMGIGWYVVLRVAAGRPVNRGLLAGGAAVALLALASLDFPYRLLVHNKFEVANWNGAECYIIGERLDEALLFCPEIEPPRNRVLQKGFGALQRLGRRENVFTRARALPTGEP